MCAIQKLKILLTAHYSKARSLWKGIPALRCHVQNMSNASALRQAVMSHCYRLVLRLNFIVTVELLYDQAESDFVQCQTKMRAFASRICSEFKQIKLNWNRLVHQNALWSLVFSSTRPWNKQFSEQDASQPSSHERWKVADLKHLKNSYILYAT